MTRWGFTVAAAVSVLLASPRPARADCVETAPSGAGRPSLAEAFPERGMSGYVATLRVTIAHGRGETVMPRGLELQSASDAARDLKSAGFALPVQGSDVGPHLSTMDSDASGGRRQTVLELPLIALPTGPGRHTLTLPPVPIAIARASGDVVTLCTKPHVLIVDDPTASTPHATPHPNPPPRIQREEWVALERGLTTVGLVLPTAALLAWAFYRWNKRPKKAPPPPPMRVPWEVAFERLDEARHAGLLETQRFAEFFDRVNDAVRQYLGARFGFDGLESTTDETIRALGRVPHFSLSMGEVMTFLQQCDLVKFADMTPTLEECQKALAQAEQVVRQTMPAVRTDSAGPAEVRP